MFPTKLAGAHKFKLYMAYTAEEVITPFWSENSGFMTGRDPLGIQNSSITVYGRLLPGMTNLTQRLRYYGIYCWLLKVYDELNPPKEQRTLGHQYNFIRRAELILAFMMANRFTDERSVIGSFYAHAHIDDVALTGVYDIRRGADKFNNANKEDLYWKYSSGALGQYYAGSLINLELIETCNKYFHIKDRGRQLAAVFESSVPEKDRKYFLGLIQQGQVSKGDLAQIQSFSLNAITLHSEEWRFYRDLLVDSDGKNFKSADGMVASKRRESIALYLAYRNANPSSAEFQEWMYSRVSSQTPENSAFFGWYYYYINEAFHFALETIFWAMLVHLDGRLVPVQTYVEEIRDTILEHTCGVLGIDPAESLETVMLSLDSTDLVKKVNDLEELARYENKWASALGRAVELLCEIYMDIEPHLDQIRAFENNNYIHLQKGHVTEHAEAYIRKNLALPFSAFVEKLIRVLMNDHIATAYRKMGNGEANLLKFIIEDNVIGHIQTMPPKHTTPRIHSLHNFLRDLGFIDDVNLLTDPGHELLLELMEQA